MNIQHTDPRAIIAAVVEACRPVWDAATEEERGEKLITDPVPVALAKAGTDALPFVSIRDDIMAYELLMASFNALGDKQEELEGDALLYTGWELESRILSATPVDYDDALARISFLRRHVDEVGGLEVERLEALFRQIHNDMVRMVTRLEAA